MPEYELYREFYRCKSVAYAASPGRGDSDSSYGSPDSYHGYHHDTSEIEEVSPRLLRDHVGKDSSKTERKKSGLQQPMSQQRSFKSSLKEQQPLAAVMKRAASKVAEKMDLSCFRLQVEPDDSRVTEHPDDGDRRGN